MKPTTLTAIQTTKKHNITLRNGSYIVSLKRILDAMKIRG